LRRRLEKKTNVGDRTSRCISSSKAENEAKFLYHQSLSVARRTSQPVCQNQGFGKRLGLQSVQKGITGNIFAAKYRLREPRLYNNISVARKYRVKNSGMQ